MLFNQRSIWDRKIKRRETSNIKINFNAESLEETETEVEILNFKEPTVRKRIPLYARSTITLQLKAILGVSIGLQIIQTETASTRRMKVQKLISTKRMI